MATTFVEAFSLSANAMHSDLAKRASARQALIREAKRRLCETNLYKWRRATFFVMVINCLRWAAGKPPIGPAKDPPKEENHFGGSSARQSPVPWGGAKAGAGDSRRGGGDEKPALRLEARVLLSVSLAHFDGWEDFSPCFPHIMHQHS